MNEVAVSPIDPNMYRQVLGQYPTGVCVITATSDEGEPVAMVVGSFSSVSLSPPLIGFYPDKGSNSWAKLKKCRHFCVNILAAHQLEICRKLASKDPEKFAGTPHSISDRGAPLLHDVVARIECEFDNISEAGDHDLALGRVIDLEVVSGNLPLLFFQGGYGAFSPSVMTLVEPKGLSLLQLRQIDRARPIMEGVAECTGGRCIVTHCLGGELVVSASVGQGCRSIATSLVGQRLPHVPPIGSIFAAWTEASQSEAWLARLPATQADVRRRALDRVRERGFSVALLNDAHRAFVDRIDVLAARWEDHYPEDLEHLIAALDYDPPLLDEGRCNAVRVISVPVFDSDGEVAFALSVFDFAKPEGKAGVRAYIEVVTSAAIAISKSLAQTNL